MSDWLSWRDEAVRRLLPPVVTFMAAFAVSAGASGGSSGRVIASGAVAEPVIRTPAALRGVEPLPDLRRRHRRPRAEPHPPERTEAVRVASPQQTEPTERTVATATPPAAPPAAASPPASAVPPPAEPPPPAHPPRTAPETPAPVPPTPTFDSSGSFDSSG